IPRHIDNIDSFVSAEQQQRRQHLSALVVQKIVIPVPLHHRRNHHRNRPIRILLLHLQHIIHNRRPHQPKRRRQCHLLRHARSRRLLSRAQPRWPILIRLARHMHRLHIRGQRHRKPQRLLRRRIPSLHRNNHNRRRQIPRCRNHPASHHQLLRHPFIMTPHPPHKHHRRRQQQHHHPSPFRKLRHHHHHHRDPRSQSPHPIDQYAVPGPRPRFRSEPVPHHPRLRQSESQKRPHRKQRNQPISHSTKQNQQQPRKNRQRPNALRVHQPPSPRRQRMRKIIVPCHDPAQPREIRKRSVRRKTQHQQHRKHRQIVKNPFPRHRRRQHRQHALIPRLPRIRSGNSVVPHQHRNAPQQHNQNRDDRRQRSPSRRNHRLAKRLHSITYRFDARQRRAPRSKRLQQNPYTNHL